MAQTTTLKMALQKEGASRHNIEFQIRQVPVRFPAPKLTAKGRKARFQRG